MDTGKLNGTVDLVRSNTGQLFISFDTSQGEYGPIGVPLNEFEKMLEDYKIS